VLIPNRFPADSSWARFAAIQQRLADNRAIGEALGAPREGPSLLAGLLVCRRCGRRLMAAYGGKANHLRYTCMRATIDDGAPGGLSLAGAVLERFVATQLLQVLQPASLELSVAAAPARRAERERLEVHWHQRLERARDNAQRAARQYEAVEPENRLVARELERRWEEALGHEQHLQEESARFQRERPPELTAREREAILRVAQDVPALWHAAETTPQDRQEIGRVVVDRVAVDVHDDREQVEVTIQWAGGVISAHRIRRPGARYDQLSNVTTLVARLDGLRQAGHSFAQIAEHLNRDGCYPPTRTDRFSGSMVARLLSLRGLHGPRPRTMVDTTVLQPYEYWLTACARTMHMPMATVHKWQRLGWVHSRKVAVAAGRWAIWADDHERARLRRLRACNRQWPEPRDPAALTTPTPRDDARRTTAPSGTAVPRA
jgi:Recombinase zinc beta ribbon domain